MGWNVIYLGFIQNTKVSWFFCLSGDVLFTTFGSSNLIKIKEKLLQNVL